MDQGKESKNSKWYVEALNKEAKKILRTYNKKLETVQAVSEITGGRMKSPKKVYKFELSNIHYFFLLPKDHPMSFKVYVKADPNSDIYLWKGNDDDKYREKFFEEELPVVV